MDMEHDWKAARIERDRVELVERMDTARRVNALEASLRYEAEAADRMRAQMVAAIECAAVERTEHAATLAHRDRVIAQQAATVGTLRAELAAAMRTIESWTADRTPALTLGLRRCEASFRGVDLVVDYDVVLGIDDSGEDCEAAETHAVWLGATDVSALLSCEADEAMAGQAQQALDDWVADEREELAVAGVPSLRESVGVL